MGRMVSLICVPLMLGANRSGIEKGPEALLDAGVPDILKKLGYSVSELGIDVPNMANLAGTKREFIGLKNLEVIRQVSASLCETVSSELAWGRFPLVLGGDHSLAIGTVAGVCSQQKTGVIWIDAHGDMNTHKTTPSGNIHGMALALSMGAGYPSLTAIGGRSRKIDPKNTVLIGARSLDPGECLMIRKFGIRLYTVEDIRRLGMARVMKEALAAASAGTQGIHLSFDMDVMDPAEAPGVSTPVPEGLRAEEVGLALEAAGRSGLLRSADIVELNPELDPDGKTAVLAAALIGRLFGSMAAGIMR